MYNSKYLLRFRKSEEQQHDDSFLNFRAVVVLSNLLPVQRNPWLCRWTGNISFIETHHCIMREQKHKPNSVSFDKSMEQKRLYQKVKNPTSIELTVLANGVKNLARIPLVYASCVHRWRLLRRRCSSIRFAFILIDSSIGSLRRPQNLVIELERKQWRPPRLERNDMPYILIVMSSQCCGLALLSFASIFLVDKFTSSGRNVFLFDNIDNTITRRTRLGFV